MTDLSKNPVEDRILDLMRTHGQLMDEIEMVSIQSKSDLDRIAQMFNIRPATYQGNEQAAVVFIKGVIIYNLMDRMEKESFLSTLHRVWGSNSRFTGAITGAIAGRVALSEHMTWQDLPNAIFVKEYAAIVHTARLIGIPLTGLEVGGAAAAAGQIGNAVVTSRTGASLFDTSRLGSALSRLGLDGAKVLRASGLVGAGVSLTAFTVEKLVERSLNQAKDEAQKRLDGTANNYEMTEEFFETELAKYDLVRDKAAVR